MDTLELIIGIYCLGAIGYLVGYILADEFGRGEKETSGKYTIRCAVNVLCVVLWPVVFLLALVCWALEMVRWYDGWR